MKQEPLQRDEFGHFLPRPKKQGWSLTKRAWFEVGIIGVFGSLAILGIWAASKTSKELDQAWAEVGRLKAAHPGYPTGNVISGGSNATPCYVTVSGGCASQSLGLTPGVPVQGSSELEAAIAKTQRHLDQVAESLGFRWNAKAKEWKPIKKRAALPKQTGIAGDLAGIQPAGAVDFSLPDASMCSSIMTFEQCRDAMEVKKPQPEFEAIQLQNDSGQLRPWHTEQVPRKKQ